MRIVMTGATSGIGLEAARVLLRQGHTLIVGARNAATAPKDISAKATFLPLDLGDLVSVQAFADAVAKEAPDALLLNAGIQVVHDLKSAQGFELTFATNHLAHFLLTRRLAPLLPQHGRIVLTASGVHDPDAKTGVPPPRHADARLLAYPDRDTARDANPGTAGRRAYAASKLCNVMTGRELARQLAASRPDIAVSTFDPGFNPGTGLARDYPPLVQVIFKSVLKIVVRGENVTAPDKSGPSLAALVSDPAYADARGGYFSMRHHTMKSASPSTLALDDGACAKLWDDSAALLAEAGFA